MSGPRDPQRPRHWTVLARDALQDCRVFQVSRVRARSPRTEREHDFFTIDSTDWVNVVALTEDEQVVLVRQYRHGSESLTLETPGGMVDAGETPAEAAARELLEESGYASDDWQELGGVNPNPALFGNRLHAYLARGARAVAEVCNDSTEETAVELVPLANVPEHVRRGEIDHALVIAVLYRLGLASG